jgi:hypothetical protein
MMSEGRTSRSQHGSDRDNQTRNCLLHPHLFSNRCEQDGRSFRQKKGTIRANCGRVLKVSAGRFENTQIPTGVNGCGVSSVSMTEARLILDPEGISRSTSHLATGS